MFIGHEVSAFVLAASIAVVAGVKQSRALTIGMIAGCFGVLPDLDIFYAAVSYLFAIGQGTAIGWNAFWGIANNVHRIVTHPLPVAVTGALIAWTVATIVSGNSNRRTPILAVGTGGGIMLIAVSYFESVGLEAAAVAIIYFATIAVVGLYLSTQTKVSTQWIGVAAGVGLIIHPFGDVFMAVPPPLFAPFRFDTFLTRIVLSTHSTINLLAITAVEILIVWVGVLTATYLSNSDMSSMAHPTVVVGALYGLLGFVLPTPTMADAHLFGFTIVPLAVATGMYYVHIHVKHFHEIQDIMSGVMVSLTTLTLSLISFITYIAVFIL